MAFTTITSWPLLIWKALEAEGVDARELFLAQGLDPDALGDPSARYPVGRVRRLIADAAQLSGASCFGLALARQWHPTTLHAIGMAWFSSYTLRDAFERLQRKLALVNDALTGDFHREGDVYLLRLTDRRDDQRPPAEAMHGAFGLLVEMARSSLGPAFAPRRVTFAHEAPDCMASLEAFFRCPVQQGADDFVLEMDAADLERPLLTGNLDLLRSADAVIADYMDRLDLAGFAARARQEILRQLPAGSVTEESVAAALHVSLRTLQRRLAEEGTAYRQLLQSVRRELAEQYIADDRYSITEIAYLLGFSEPSSFARSFRRWTGSSPSASRREA